MAYEQAITAGNLCALDWTNRHRRSATIYGVVSSIYGVVTSIRADKGAICAGSRFGMAATVSDSEDAAPLRRCNVGFTPLVRVKGQGSKVKGQGSRVKGQGFRFRGLGLRGWRALGQGGEVELFSLKVRSSEPVMHSRCGVERLLCIVRSSDGGTLGPTTASRGPYAPTTYYHMSYAMSHGNVCPYSMPTYVPTHFHTSQCNLRCEIKDIQPAILAAKQLATAGGFEGAAVVRVMETGAKSNAKARGPRTNCTARRLKCL
eukprot:3941573-Rhodomonas_salina.5